MTHYAWRCPICNQYPTNGDRRLHWKRNPRCWSERQAAMEAKLAAGEHYGTREDLVQDFEAFMASKESRQLQGLTARMVFEAMNRARRAPPPQDDLRSLQRRL